MLNVLGHARKYPEIAGKERKATKQGAQGKLTT